MTVVHLFYAHCAKNFWKREISFRIYHTYPLSELWATLFVPTFWAAADLTMNRFLFRPQCWLQMKHWAKKNSNEWKWHLLRAIWQDLVRGRQDGQWSGLGLSSSCLPLSSSWQYSYHLWVRHYREVYQGLHYHHTYPLNCQDMFYFLFTFFKTYPPQFRFILHLC